MSLPLDRNVKTVELLASQGADEAPSMADLLAFLGAGQDDISEAGLSRMNVGDNRLFSDGRPDSFTIVPEVPGENETGTNANEVLAGGAGDDTLNGVAGNDVLHGLGGEDDLQGGFGEDTLYGGAAQDTLDGGPGNDSLLGGDGPDVFSFVHSPLHLIDGGLDIVADMDLAQDRLQFFDEGVPIDFSVIDMADYYTALPGDGGAELWFEHWDGLTQIFFFEGVDAAQLQAMIVDESILA